MKSRFASILGVFAAILMVASFVVQVNIATPAVVTADPGIMKWDTVITPGTFYGLNDINNYHKAGSETGSGNEVLSMSVGGDGKTVVMIFSNSYGYIEPTEWDICYNGLLYCNGSGISGTQTRWLSLLRQPLFGYPLALSPDVRGPVHLYHVAVAPDDPQIMAVTSDYCDQVSKPVINGFRTGPRRIWYTTDSGWNWELAYDGGRFLVDNTASGGLGATEYIRAIDISIDYGGKRDIGFVTTSRTTGGRWFVRPSDGFKTWQDQTAAPKNHPPVDAITGLIQYEAIRFSPTYNGDSSVALVYASNAPASNANRGTFFNVAFRDLHTNSTLGWAYGAPGIKLFNSVNSKPGTHAGVLSNVSLQLPSDFSGQSASLRRAYVSLDALVVAPAKPGGPTFPVVKTTQDGIYRVDDTTLYVLMDTSDSNFKSIYSIAYVGTYASGKLLAGEVMGFPCTATVPTWFTDSPTTCPIPCWYPAMKPTTGAANQGVCSVGSQTGVGAALVGWNADGSLGMVATGSLPYTPYVYDFIDEIPGDVPFWWYQAIYPPIPNDESAFAVSRNNGETWNQTILIDTTIDWFNDVAVSPDCTTIYLASTNRNTGLPGYCNEFDSVWRTTINPNVAAPLPAVPPLGTLWERVFCHVTSGSCNTTQSDLPLLRIVPSCTDKPDGEIVAWAAQGARAAEGSQNGVMAWSPDFGDYWAMIVPRLRVQDFTFESSTVMYVLDKGGIVQRLTYTGTAWSTNLPSYDTTLLGGHTIVAVPEGKVLVGASAGVNYPAGYSADKGVVFKLLTDLLPRNGNEHVIFDVDFKNNSFIYMGDDSYAGATQPGTVYRNTVPAYARWTDSDMMALGNGGKYIFDGVADLAWPAGNNPPHPVGIFGLVQAWTGAPQPALYAAHDNVTTSLLMSNSAVCRTLRPRDGMPKPGIMWDCLDIFAPLNTTGVKFTLEPTSLKYGGCCTLDTNTTLYAIDDQSGNWTYTPGSSARTYKASNLSGRYWGSESMDPYNHPEEPNIRTPWLGYAHDWKRGSLWAYTDCLAKKGPVLKGPADKSLVGADPVTGRNQQVDLSWEQLCLSTWYQIQVAKDAAFTLRIDPSQNGMAGGVGRIRAVTGSILMEMDETNMTSPAAWLAPAALPEAGAIYYWRVRSAKSATQQIAASPWSGVRSFTVKAGFIVNTPYYGVQLLAPNNGCSACKVKPASFSWSPWKEATRYQFDLAKDPEFKTLVVTSTTGGTGYEYSGTLDYGTNYFWRVKALEVKGQNIPSDWSATFSLVTEPAPAPSAPPPAEPATPIWVWALIANQAIFMVLMIILILQTRRTY